MYHTRPINTAEKQNFETLVTAIKSDRICLISSFDSHDRRPAVLVCAVNYSAEAHECFEFVPLAVLCSDNPYERFIPPSALKEE